MPRSLVFVLAEPQILSVEEISKPTPARRRIGDAKSAKADSVQPAMGSLVKKRRKRMRKKKHRKMLKRTRAQRQRGK